MTPSKYVTIPTASYRYCIYKIKSEFTDKFSNTWYELELVYGNVHRTTRIKPSKCVEVNLDLIVKQEKEFNNYKYKLYQYVNVNT